MQNERKPRSFRRVEYISLAPQRAASAPQSAPLAPQSAALVRQDAALTRKRAALAPQRAALVGLDAALTPQSAALTPQRASLAPLSAALGRKPAALTPQSAALAPQSAAFDDMRNANAAVSSLCDIHHHIVWGIDSDGPKTMEDSKAMALAAVRDGITHIVTTPHVMPGIAPFDGERFRQRLAALQSWCRDQGLPLRLYPGAEIFYTPMTVQYLNEGRVPTMNGTAHVLVEFDPGERYEQIRKACAELTAHGYIPILAHTERYTALVRHPKAALVLREELGLAFQVNCGTVIAPKGFWQQRFIKTLLKEGALDMVATDAHNMSTRPVRMKEAIAALERYGTNAATILQHSSELLRTTV